MGSKPKINIGFSLIELIIVLLIVGVLAVVVMPRMFTWENFSTRAFYDQSLAMVRYGQKIAIAQRTHVQVRVEFSSALICLKYAKVDVDFPCISSQNNVLNPADNKPFVQAVPREVRLKLNSSNGGTFDFNALGRPSSGATLLISGNGTERKITVEQETGYVH